MKAIVVCLIVLAFAAGEVLAQCGANGVQGGCGNVAPRQGNPGGRQAAPLIPPTTPPDLAQPSGPPAIVIPAGPMLPVPSVPNSPAPQIAQAKSCECNNAEISDSLAKVAAALNGLKSDLSTARDRLTALEESTPPGPAVDEAALAKRIAEQLRLNKPPSDGQKVNHYVLVADGSANSFTQLQAWLTAARAKFPAIRLVSASEVPYPVAGGYPQLVGYDAEGHPVDVLKGYTPVERELSRIAMR